MAEMGPLNEESQSDYDRYFHAAHAMQTGVALWMNMEPGESETTPKHLRVGVNSSMVSDAALTKLLIEKGIFTQEEFMKALADQMELEVAMYESRLPPGTRLA